ncbi:MAG: (2Fe-2S)-binding protein [Acidobacteria bacterium]|nr:(2Fe-2S)-binding protein [Acidobacteriota bacterium]
MKKKQPPPQQPFQGVTRRGFLTGVGTAVVSSAVLGPAMPSTSAQVVRAAPPQAIEEIALIVNGTQYHLAVEPRWTLAEVLRDHLGLTGTKIGCNAGECGACTVIVESKPVYACSQLAVWLDGKKITTVEGLASAEVLDPLQESFIAHDAPQCGYCTSGQLMSAKALLTRNPSPTRDEVQRALTGNLCRCSNYNRIVEAVLAAASEPRLP